MASGNAKSEDSEFEPDSNFFDNFLDGMDVLIDNCKDPADDERWIAEARTDEESDSSSCGDRMVIDLPSSPDTKNSKEVNNEESCDIKAILTSRVLAQLEKSSSHHRNKISNSFPSNQLVVDVLDRLKKSVQKKNESPSSSIASHQETSKTNLMKSKIGNEALQLNFQEDILSDISAESDYEEHKRGSEETMTELFKWIFSKKAKSRSEQFQGNLSRRVNPFKDSLSLSNKDKRKRRKHEKHKSSKSNKEKQSKRRSRHKRKYKTKSYKGGIEEDKGVTSVLSLESVSSEGEDDILNKHSEEESLKAGMPNLAKLQESPKPTDCEEGEVLSSSSDWESEHIVKKRLGENLKPLIPARTECFSPLSSDGLWPRRFKRRKPSPSWLGQRHRSEERERLAPRRMRSPAHYIRVSPWREQLCDRPRLWIPVSRPDSPPSIPIHQRPRSPNSECHIGEQLPSFIDGFGCPVEMFSPRRMEHELPSLHRPRTPREDLHESRHLFKSYAPKEIQAREVGLIPCPPLRTERRLPPERECGIVSERCKKSGLLLRCLQEIRQQSCKPGRFIYDPESKVSSTETSIPINRYSSPLYPSESKTFRLKYTTPTTRHIGTSSDFLKKAAVSVGCQTNDENFSNSGEQVQKCDHLQIQASTLPAPVLPKVKRESSLTIPNPGPLYTGTLGAVSAHVMSKRCHVSVASKVSREDFVQKIVSSISVSNESNFPLSSQRTLEMWKTIVSYRYPDLSEKEIEQVVLVKSMEASQHTVGK